MSTNNKFGSWEFWVLADQVLETLPDGILGRIQCRCKAIRQGREGIRKQIEESKRKEEEKEHHWKELSAKYPRLSRFLDGWFG